jgi:hypothetical protein
MTSDLERRLRTIPVENNQVLSDLRLPDADNMSRPVQVYLVLIDPLAANDRRPMRTEVVSFDSGDLSRWGGRCKTEWRTVEMKLIGGFDVSNRRRKSNRILPN